ncbi:MULTISPECIES: NUDIX hydrolase family protein [Brachybacterium]|uniref:ADP-ribose pyrophosphatase YjhB (NUDIX family) n=1 Tax=Brachybacterium fresconis TaxID=173363 RepID=A0ABS4YH51_9MICO|nr:MULTISPECIES: NUDIX hydrolase family protein [Brachybacterium]MBP2408123.1 ADP-ribose pyrophosphatase YjhB (NUDIX family) [Brachybacterium fresconis]MDN5686646.1 NUDIX hydrolase family protein [Brachybacterium sp.]
MNNRTAVDAEGAWFEPEDIAQLRRRLPIPYVDVVPVRTDVDGSVVEVGLLLRASGDGQIVRAIVSGRVMIHETIREAIGRNVEKDLGPMALPRIPVSPVPFTVAEYFPTPGISPFHDPRQHAISMAYIVPVDGETAPQEDALDLAWFGIDELLADPSPLSEMNGGRDLLVRRALAHVGAA